MELDQIEKDFKELVKTIVYFDLPLKIGRYAMLLEPKRMKILAIDAIAEMQEAHLLELDSDPTALDGGNLETLDESEHEFDERTCRTSVYDGLLAPLPHETR